MVLKNLKIVLNKSLSPFPPRISNIYNKLARARVLSSTNAFLNLLIISSVSLYLDIPANISKFAS